MSYYFVYFTNMAEESKHLSVVGFVSLNFPRNGGHYAVTSKAPKGIGGASIC